MAVDVWEEVTVEGVEYWQIETARFRVPKVWVPGSNMFIAVAAPTGNGNFPAMLQGEEGPRPTLTPEVDLTVLPYGDVTPPSSTWTETSPGVYQEIRVIHQGPGGDDGVMVLDLEDYGTPVAGQILVLNSTADALEWQPPWVGDKYWPAALNNTPSGNVAYTLGSIAIAGQPRAWRPSCSAQTLVTATGTGDAQVDLIARLNNETSGNIVGRGLGTPGVGPRPVVLHDGPPAGSPTDHNRVEAGADAVIFLRAERQNGVDTFTTSATTTLFSVKVDPIP